MFRSIRATTLGTSSSSGRQPRPHGWLLTDVRLRAPAP